MSEHTHHWVLYEPDDREKVFAECLWGWKENDYVKQCDAMLDEEEIHRRLNAYDKLVAERDLLLRGLGINDPSRIAEVLPASALEGESDE